MFDFDSLDEAEIRSQAPVRAQAAARPVPVRVCRLEGGVAVSIFQEGDPQKLPVKSLEIDYVGRLPSGCSFDCSAGKGQPPMKVELGTGGAIPGMELGLRALSLGAVAEIRIPGNLGYGERGIPKMIPPNSELLFEVHVLAVDGQGGPQRRRPSRLAAPWRTRRAGGELPAAREGRAPRGGCWPAALLRRSPRGPGGLARPRAAPHGPRALGGPLAPLAGTSPAVRPS
ncbi:unnamed protein product [Prorocentrum cordatum]|uniref:peptidylprolyl isomerase n=1 Tax=Prorocentrum cordatum TaxID=2364126 RepID=A0ABN9VDA6_9DINO|nr:unnamed protein product [Polarella glacialis]